MTMITVYEKKSILDTRLALLLGLVCNKGGEIGRASCRERV